MDNKRGVCPVCEQKISILNRIPTKEDLESTELWPGEYIYWELVPHDFYGEPCDGSNQCRQTVLK